MRAFEFEAVPDEVAEDWRGAPPGVRLRVVQLYVLVVGSDPQKQAPEVGEDQTQPGTVHGAGSRGFYDLIAKAGPYVLVQCPIRARER